MAPFILIAPASRGIGHALTRLVLQRTSNIPIIATARSNPDATKESLLSNLDRSVDESRLHVLKLDVTGTRPNSPLWDYNLTLQKDESTIESAASATKDLLSSSSSKPLLRLAFAIPGILYPEKSPAQVSATDALETYKVNTLGPLLLMKHFLPFLPRKKDELEAIPLSSSAKDKALAPSSTAVWASMSARVGSTSQNSLGGWYSYRSSKAGVNALTKSFDIHLKNSSGEKAMGVALHPGTVKTGLSKEFWSSVQPDHLFTPEQAAEYLLDVVGSMKIDQRGRCWDWEGKEIPP